MCTFRPANSCAWLNSVTLEKGQVLRHSYRSVLWPNSKAAAVRNTTVGDLLTRCKLKPDTLNDRTPSLLVNPAT